MNGCLLKFSPEWRAGKTAWHWRPRLKIWHVSHWLSLPPSSMIHCQQFYESSHWMLLHLPNTYSLTCFPDSITESKYFILFSYNASSSSSSSSSSLGHIAPLARFSRYYRWSSGVYWSVTSVNPAKAVEPIVMLFGMSTWVGQGNMYCMGYRSPCKEAILRGKVAAHCEV